MFISIFCLSLLFTLVLKRPNGEWPITYTNISLPTPLPSKANPLACYISIFTCLLLCDTKTWVRIHRPVHLNLDLYVYQSSLCTLVRGRCRKFRKRGPKNSWREFNFALHPTTTLYNEHLWSELILVTTFFQKQKHKNETVGLTSPLSTT